jgi:hypothetical protein
MKRADLVNNDEVHQPQLRKMKYDEKTADRTTTMGNNKTASC